MLLAYERGWTMTEANENESNVPASVDPSTFTTVREHRHHVSGLVRAAKHPLGAAIDLLRGVVGLTQAQQVERFEQAAEAVTGAQEALAPAQEAIQAGRDYAATRDFEAHQATKGANRASVDRPDPSSV